MKRKSLLLGFFLMLVASLCVFMFAACDKNPNDDTPTQTEIKVVPETVDVVIGKTVNVMAQTQSTETIEWTLEDPSLATITATYGKRCTVKGVTKGTTTLTATVEGNSAVCTLNVITPDEVETVAISSNGSAVTKVSMEEGKTLQLTATGSKGTPIASWTSSDTQKLTVSNSGLLQALRPGTVTVTAAINSEIFAEVTVEITAQGGEKYYDLKYGEEAGIKAFNEKTGAFDGETLVENEFFYWAASSRWQQQEVSVEYAYCQGGTVKVKYTSDWDPGYWFGFQLFYKAEGHKLNATYKLSCDFKVDIDCDVTLNGNVVNLKKGANHVEVYYVYTAPLNNSGTSSFDLAMGIDDRSTLGKFVKDVEFEISNVTWTEDTGVQKLPTPSFTLSADDVISITDSASANVGNYRLSFFKDGVNQGSVLVKNGQKVNPCSIEAGTYTVKLQSLAKDAHYLNSDYSAEAQMTVTTAPSYELTNGGNDGAVMEEGKWMYWTQPWVNVTQKTYSNGKLTFEFSNNAGLFDATQIYFKSPTNEVGKNYEMSFDLTLDGNSGGMVIVSGNNVELKSGKNTYTVIMTEGTGASFALLFSIYGNMDNGDKICDIDAATVTIENLTFKLTDSTPQPQPQPQPQPTSGFGTNTDAINNPNTWYYWNDQNWTGSNVKVTEYSLTSEKVSATFTGTGKCDFGLQFFYDDPTHVAGKEYTLSFTVVSTFDVTISVNGQSIELKANVAQTLTVTAAEQAVSDYQGSSVSIQVPINGNTSGTITFTDVKFV